MEGVEGVEADVEVGTSLRVAEVERLGWTGSWTVLKMLVTEVRSGSRGGLS